MIDRSGLMLTHADEFLARAKNQSLLPDIKLEQVPMPLLLNITVRAKRSFGCSNCKGSQNFGAIGTDWYNRH